MLVEQFDNQVDLVVDWLGAVHYGIHFLDNCGWQHRLAPTGHGNGWCDVQ